MKAGQEKMKTAQEATKDELKANMKVTQAAQEQVTCEIKDKFV